MSTSTMRKALGAVKDTTSIGLARVISTSNSVPDLEVAVVKATRHEEYPADEKHVREILNLTFYSRAYVNACVNSLSKRLNKTRNWAVALKVLMLIHRLLADGDPAFQREIFFTRHRGTRLLNMSDFRDASRKNSWDFSAFVRTYARFLDEKLEMIMHGRQAKPNPIFGYDEDEEDAGSEPAVRTTPISELKSVARIFSKTQQLQQLLERFLACRPTGAAKNSRVVIVALHLLVKESFQIYYDISEIMGLLVDRFVELEVPDCVKVFDILSGLVKQFDELEHFYSWCKNVGIARSSEYPEIERISPKKLEVMDEFIRDKSSSIQCKRARSVEEQKNETMQKDPELTVEKDMNAIKALPPPQGFSEVDSNGGKEEEKVKSEKEADFLNLHEDEMKSDTHQGDKLALALFDGVAAAPQSPAPATSWEAFTDESSDWETALVKSASNLSNQKPSLGGGLDMLLLDGMYQHSAVAAASGGTVYGATGSASSVAFRSAGQPMMVALPAPQVEAMSSGDPFAASLAMPPPAYVQMSEMEKKQRLLVEEQLMWQQYSREGMQGQVGIARLRANPLNPYTYNY